VLCAPELPHIAQVTDLRIRPFLSLTELTVLGAGGWIPTGAYATCTALLREGPAAVVIDAGTGIQRLVVDPSPLPGGSGSSSC
jgi:hypothetical protein